MTLMLQILPIVSALASVMMSIFLAYHGRTATSSIMATLSGAMLLLANLSSIDTLKVLGLEAKMNVKLNQAEDILNKVKSIGDGFLVLSYLSLNSSAQFGSYVWVNNISYSKILDEVSSELKVKDEKLDVVRNQFRTSFILIAVYRCVSAINEVAGPEAQENYRSIPQIEMFENYYFKINEENFATILKEYRNSVIKNEAKIRLTDKYIDNLSTLIKSSLKNYQVDGKLSRIYSSEFGDEKAIFDEIIK